LTVVLDSNVVVALALDTEHALVINRCLREWQETEEDLHAPSLFRYEVANALTRNIVAGAIDLSDATAAWQRAIAMPITLHSLEDGVAVIAIARQLQRESAYDAAYVALAEELDADLWTLDGPLSRNASAYGFPVHMITSSLS
jgi:predicted nucleic acid-binding protein